MTRRSDHTRFVGASGDRARSRHQKKTGRAGERDRRVRQKSPERVASLIAKPYVDLHQQRPRRALDDYALGCRTDDHVHDRSLTATPAAVAPTVVDDANVTSPLHANQLIALLAKHAARDIHSFIARPPFDLGSFAMALLNDHVATLVAVPLPLRGDIVREKAG